VAEADRLVILDIGETLVSGPDSGPAQRIAGELGLTSGQARELGRALMTTDFGGPGGVAEHLVQEFVVDRERACTVSARVWRAQEHEAQPIDGALQVLGALSAAGLRLAVLSNIWQPYCESALRHVGPFFDANVPADLQHYSFRTGRAKPDPAAFAGVLDAAGAAPGDAVMIGDNHRTDIRGAMGAGLRWLWLRPGLETGAAGTVSDIRGVTPEVIEALWSGG
jgi:FMN phosphatase YigB (HAD superfamily)